MLSNKNNVFVAWISSTFTETWKSKQNITGGIEANLKLVHYLDISEALSVETRELPALKGETTTCEVNAYWNNNIKIKRLFFNSQIKVNPT